MKKMESLLNQNSAMKGKVKVIFLHIFQTKEVNGLIMPLSIHAARKIQIKKSINFILFSASLRIVN